MPDRTPSSWYTAVSGCVRCGRDGTAFELMRGMREHGVPLSGFALASLVTACERRRGGHGRDEGLACGAAIHALTHRAGLMGNVYIATALLHMYGSCGVVFDAQRLFWEMPERNVVSWTALMVALSSNGYLEEALVAYRQMRKEGVMCNANAFATVVSLCGSLQNEVPGLQVASHVIVSGLQNQVSVANSLITMFGNMGRVQDAERLFDRMEEHDTISWNAIISIWLKEKNEVSTFGIGDRGHKYAEKIYAKLDEILPKLKEVGYAADTSSALHDTDEEQNEQNLWNHCEKLALAYGLIVVPEGSTIRIFKNLRETQVKRRNNEKKTATKMKKN
ncbi:hypothetical protein E2562_024306 [Oryza meyeriana var. granulata]|uniref:DYW domain-containing protein n=1 Tax=Oryza meyeriana var. granulata TaxID=110450 RepID=A0A6G1C8W7_9ORYZ|nr:hypothetical protein E2562_024306 [Oryza meyeriana var. granulata]